ncbi:MAG: hypothetical protein LAN70_05595 [Acidobacteriia bacterium]|nr:hypothetical protein [Terriglobia bacterium]
MPTSDDELGDLLRYFYDTYGVPKEGPPANLNVSKVMGGLSDLAPELRILSEAVNDEALRRQFRDCRTILDDLATRLTSEELLRELLGVPLPSEHAFQQLSSGVLWFSLASSLDARNEGLPTTPLNGIIDLPLGLRVQMAVHGSLVLRLYIALVYMREGVLNDLITEGARAGGPCSGCVKKLLNSEYVRRIRNALSHGSFTACIAGIVFRDDHGAVVATPGFLSWLSTWLMLIQLQALAASSRKPHIT